MQTTGIRTHGKNLHYYYRCPRRVRDGKDACPNGKNYRADRAEPRVWELVSGLLKDPETLEADLERMIEQERKRLRSGPEEEAATWMKRLDECTKQREKRLEQHAEGLIDLDELRAKLSAIEETREVAERELRRLKELREEMAGLERDKQELLETYTRMAPEALASLTPEERHRLYGMLRLTVTAHPDGTLEAVGVLASDIVSEAEISGRDARTLSGPRWCRYAWASLG
jgi:hypothetical protein